MSIPGNTGIRLAIVLLVVLVISWVAGLDGPALLLAVTGVGWGWYAWEQQGPFRQLRRKNEALNYQEDPLKESQTPQLQDQQLQDQQQYVALLEEDNSQLHAQLQQLQRVTETSAQQLANRNQYVDLLETELSQHQRDLTGYQNQVQALTAEKTTLEQQLIHARQQLDEQLDGVAASASNSQASLEPASQAMGEVYHLVFDVRCLEDLKTFQAKDYKQVLSKILQLQTDPRPQGYEPVKKYRDRHRNLYRIRSGNYRVCYTVTENPLKQVRIIMVDNRDERIYDERLARRVG